jgi:hypothetical protein
MAMLLKHWARRSAHILNARGGWLSPYALTVLLIYFLKARGALPAFVDPASVGPIMGTLAASPIATASVDALLASAGDDNAAGAIDESAILLPLPAAGELIADTVAAGGGDADSLPALMHGFFRFYADFDYDNDVVDIRAGGDAVGSKAEWEALIRAECAPATDAAPATGGAGEPLSHEKRDHGSAADRLLWQRLGYNVMCIRDPFEAHSLGRGVEFFRAEAIREEFRKIAESDADPDALFAL